MPTWAKRATRAGDGGSNPEAWGSRTGPTDKRGGNSSTDDREGGVGWQVRVGKGGPAGPTDGPARDPLVNGKETRSRASDSCDATCPDDEAAGDGEAKPKGEDGEEGQTTPGAVPRIPDPGGGQESLPDLR